MHEIKICSHGKSRYTTTHWAFAPLAKKEIKKKSNNNTSTHKRERLWGGKKKKLSVKNTWCVAGHLLIIGCEKIT